MEEHLEIGQLSDEEIVHCLDSDLFPSPPVLHGYARIKELYGVRIHYSLPKQVGFVANTSGQSVFGDLKKMRRQVDEVVHALRIYKSGQVSVAGTVQFLDMQHLGLGIYKSWVPGNSGQGTQAYFYKEYRLSNEEPQDFVAFWQELQNAKNEKFIANAVRRFGFASDRDLPDDSLVDLMIAAESLFLRESDAGDAKERGAMSYRLAEHFAFFVGEVPGCPRRSLFRQIKNAYDVRSAIVHGSAPRERSLKIIDEKVSMKEFVEITEQLLRAALKKMIHSKATNALPNWTKLIFG